MISYRMEPFDGLCDFGVRTITFVNPNGDFIYAERQQRIIDSLIPGYHYKYYTCDTEPQYIGEFQYAKNNHLYFIGKDGKKICIHCVHNVLTHFIPVVVVGAAFIQLGT
jgi:hypothetical protein